MEKSHLWLTGICCLKGCTETLHFGDARVETTADFDWVYLAIEPKAISSKGRVSACSGCAPEVILAQSNRERGVGGQDERLITLAPVSIIM